MTVLIVAAGLVYFGTAIGLLGGATFYATRVIRAYRRSDRSTR